MTCELGSLGGDEKAKGTFSNLLLSFLFISIISSHNPTVQGRLGHAIDQSEHARGLDCID
ncbi:unnamed protein product [Sphenostylis stenocarpa]|uniref:Uncharacterized protein n=1 Tax=Sphenostylis stenocarpa TaxID=92480 RepID=A0AA86VPA3_9FABA|nr:unnamed protein product [Sphenostylis stenocarpa]